MNESFLTLDLIRDGLEAARGTGAATAAVPVKDTIKLGDDNEMVRETLHRQRLWAVQTPQVFRFDIITRAHGQVTDDRRVVTHRSSPACLPPTAVGFGGTPETCICALGTSRIIFRFVFIT